MINLQDGHTYIRQDKRLILIKKTGFHGFLQYQGSDGTYYTNTGRTSNPQHDIIGEYESPKATNSGKAWDISVAIAIVLVLMWAFI